MLSGLINNASAQAVQLDGSVPMTGNLNMGSKKITNLNTDAADVGSAANVRHVNNANAKLILTLSKQFDEKIKESHITSSTSKKDAFRYIMEEVDVVSASLIIGQQSTKLFPKYSRSIVHLHKYDISPPELIYLYFVFVFIFFLQFEIPLNSK